MLRNIALQAVIGTLFGIAVLTLSARVITRIYYRRRLYLDDFFLLFGVVCLSGATGLVLNFSRIIFAYEVLTLDPHIVVSIQELSKMKSSLAVTHASDFLTWTTIYCAKFSFIALFRKLIRRTSKRITIYVRFVATCTFVSWMIAASRTFIVCHYFGPESGNINFIHPSKRGFSADLYQSKMLLYSSLQYYARVC